MDDRKLLATGGIGVTIAAICCFTPVLGIALGMLGLAAWLAWADLAMLPLLLICLAIVAVATRRLLRSRRHP